MTTERLIYEKVGRKYIPIGVCTYKDWLSEGLWYVKVGKSSRGYTNTEYIGEILKVADDKPLPILDQCMMNKVAEKVLEKFKFPTGSFCWNDIAHEIVKLVFEVSKEENAIKS